MVTSKQDIHLDDERRELIRENMHLVKFIASKIAIFLPQHIDTEDLVHEGLLGLMDAAIKFNSQAGMKFSTYAAIRIKGSILDALRSLDWIPRRIRKISKKIDKAREELQQRLKREPSLDEISDHLQVEKNKVCQIINAVEQSQMFSFEDLQSFTNRYYVSEDRFSPVTPSSDQDDYQKMEMKEHLKLAIDELGEKERLVLALYYLEDLTLKEIKHILNISEARISQIHTNALRKLREKLDEKFPQRKKAKRN